ncbi:hypothetical protein [Citrobacter sp. RHB35-C21]|nr:hypothetical protein [Citrobacter sp. RHB35-C21]QMD55225.1 hypothetical protein HVZ39_24945 [Citrobacter sp. RHB35-C21]
MAIVLLQIGIFGLRDRVNVDGQRLRANGKDVVVKQPVQIESPRII